MGKIRQIVAYAAVAVAVVGGGAFAITTIGSPPTSSVAVEPVVDPGELTDGSALPCERVQEIERSVQARGAVPGPEQWPPFQPGFDPNAPRPEPPIDPETGKPKGGDVPPLQRAQNAPDLGERPCGAVVDTIRARVADTGGTFWICYLEDGRYATTMAADGPEPISTPKARDELCRQFGYARSVQ